MDNYTTRDVIDAVFTLWNLNKSAYEEYSNLPIFKAFGKVKEDAKE
ncbi:hypothetical protein [Bacillus sp. FSL K6-6540]